MGFPFYTMVFNYREGLNFILLGFTYMVYIIVIFSGIRYGYAANIQSLPDFDSREEWLKRMKENIASFAPCQYGVHYKSRTMLAIYMANPMCSQNGLGYITFAEEDLIFLVTVF